LAKYLAAYIVNSWVELHNCVVLLFDSRRLPRLVAKRRAGNESAAGFRPVLVN
jgi:hypothetical protein